LEITLESGWVAEGARLLPFYPRAKHSSVKSKTEMRSSSVFSVDAQYPDLVHLPDGSILCKLCSKHFSSFKNGKSHLRRIHYPQSVECSICKMVQSSVLAFRCHVNQTHGIKGVKGVLETYGRILD
jgi:hypothetical protein